MLEEWRMCINDGHSLGPVSDIVVVSLFFFNNKNRSSQLTFPRVAPLATYPTVLAIDTASTSFPLLVSPKNKALNLNTRKTLSELLAFTNHGSSVDAGFRKRA
jgi:hypothetical protein